MTVYSGVDDVFRRPIDEARLREVRAKYSLPERFVLYAGAIYPPKNFTRLVRAYAKVGPERGVPLVIAGGENRFLSEREVRRARGAGHRRVGPPAGLDRAAGPRRLLRAGGRAAAAFPLRVVRASGARGDGVGMPRRDGRPVRDQGAGRGRRGAGGSGGRREHRRRHPPRAGRPGSSGGADPGWTGAQPAVHLAPLRRADARRAGAGRGPGDPGALRQCPTPRRSPDRDRGVYGAAPDRARPERSGRR